MRRRLREQRRMREALLLDLGALVFELQRLGRREPELLQAKAAELSAVDAEVRALADALDAGHSVLELVSTGVAGSCGSCGSLLSTDSRYCPACGAPAMPSGGESHRAGADPSLAAGRRAEAPVFPEPGRSGIHPPALGGSRRDTAGRAQAAPGRLDRMRELVRRRNQDG